MRDWRGGGRAPRGGGGGARAGGSTPPPAPRRRGAPPAPPRAPWAAPLAPRGGARRPRGGRGGVGVGRLRVVDEGPPPPLAYRSHAMGEPRKRSQHTAQGVIADPEIGRRGRRRQGVGDVVGTAAGKLRSGQQRRAVRRPEKASLQTPGGKTGGAGGSG